MHVYQKIAALTVGALFVSGPGKHLRRILARRRPPLVRPDLKVAIVAHAYYLELLDEILECRSMLQGVVPLFVTVPFDRLKEAERLLRDVQGVAIHPYVNRGRDIAPFLMLLQSGKLDQFDAVLKLHTKRSPHLLDGETRRKLLFAMLCGEREAASRTVAMFAEPTTGIVGWAACYRTGPSYWMDNEARVREVSARMGADSSLRLGFFEGSMFWFRPSALAALSDLALSMDDFEIENGQLDGTLHHTLERCFTIAAWARGYIVRDLRGRVLP
ncbi:rhamnan synthesis F family protein [Bosea eneae]|uniref:Rhamnan synthesis F family protein n=1 Tax=Bosea eneae TaxID=151454 RepID=A0ABW0IQ34_9HYPH